VRDAFKAMPIKTDRNDARGIAQLLRLCWFRPVHCKSVSAQETRALLTARKLLQSKQHDMEMSLRGVLRGFGHCVAQTATPGSAGVDQHAAGVLLVMVRRGLAARDCPPAAWRS
jgi:transposase